MAEMLMALAIIVVAAAAAVMDDSSSRILLDKEYGTTCTAIGSGIPSPHQCSCCQQPSL